jgi:integrase
MVFSSAGQLKHFRLYGCLRTENQQRWKLRKLTEYFSSLVERYFADECKSGSINKSTARNTVYGARQLLFELEDSGFVTFDEVTPRIVNDCITRITMRYTGGASGLLTCLRRFLRYIHSSGITISDLSTALPELTVSRRAIKPGFCDDDKIAILSSCANNPNTLSKRDYAIMLLAAQTGLRGCDVIALKRESINWRTNEIKVVQAKTGKAIIIPLPVDAGNAIADYLLNYRPESNDPHIFLCIYPPYHRLKVAGGIVKRYVDMAGIASQVPERSGFHSFRRAFGKSLLESETSLWNFYVFKNI